MKANIFINYPSLNKKFKSGKDSNSSRIKVEYLFQGELKMKLQKGRE